MEMDATPQRRLLRVLRRQDGLALPLALSVLVVLGIGAFSVSQFTTLNIHAAARDASLVNANSYAEAALNSAYAVIAGANTTGKNPAAANLLGCAGVNGAADTNGPSNCTSPSPLLLCYTAAPCTAGTIGNATVYGYFSGTTAATFNGVAVPASTWLLIAKGWAPDNQAAVVTQTKMALVKISALNSGAIAAVWNHVFVTAPLQPNVCALSFGGNGVSVNVPLYVVGNVCLGSGGTGVSVVETTQPVDFQVGGKLVLLGGSKVGTDSTHGITSGVVVGGCNTTSVSAATSSCATGFNYWAKKTDTWVDNAAPAESAADQLSDWQTFDPGPKHTCQAGTTPSPLAASVFDNDSASNLGTEPNASNASFELTPNFSYACISTSGLSKGYLVWNNGASALTVSGLTVPAKTLAIGGSILFDGNMTISQTATYTGSAVIETAGTITFNGNGTTLCAESPCNTAASAWQGSSGNNSMLTLVSLVSNTTAITFSNNAQTFQGSLWTQPSSSMTFVKNGVTVDGPMAIGSMDATFNNATLIPLPVIKNMPVGAPVPPNTSASIGTLQLLN
jgi:Tfp pilus assembly protein PilX